MSVERYFQSSSAAPRPSLSARFSDLGLVAVLVTIVALLFLPLPIVVVDMLVAINITLGVTLLLTTLYIRAPLDFSAFPAILLVSTLFRLALSITTTRLILSEGHGGHIIQTFGQLMAAGNVVVGLVMFLIITVVQFIVIAKGAERVAEVAARFSLDSMPGKQLSIDSDLRSGLIDKDEARRRRRVLELESKLHGSLDGAMKFVKGDAIASIVIVVVNLIGGLAIGVLQQGMEVGAATHQYSILTIGEGLVAQIPALLGAMAAGLMVTRSIDEERDSNLGQAIQRQLTAQPRVLLVVGAIALAFALIPGFPTVTFVLLGLALMLAGASLHPRLRPHVLRHAGPLRRVAARGREAPRAATLAAEPAPPRPILPLLLQLSGPRPSQVEEEALAAALRAMLDRLQHRSGVPLPRLAIHFVAPERARAWQLLAYELPVGAGAWDTSEAAVAAIAALMRRQLPRFLGVQEAVTLLNRVGEDYPEVVKEAVRALPAPRIAEVLRRLAAEEVSLRNMRDVLEGLTDAAAQERDVPRIADLTRVAVRRYLFEQAALDGTVRALVVAPELETAVRDSVRLVDGVERAALPPEVARQLIDAIAAAARDTGATALVTAFEVRRAMRQLIEEALFDLPVMAFNELSATTSITVVGQVGMPAGIAPSYAAPALADAQP
ncbi:flagellar biosynthesis protein FlhA [Sphingomonas sp. BK235]|uniref:flagellar biosynthesis protein FlhA n=1 Tax=Sphingomonas sp. BK235 TaxID=2512131 RepID=UPI00104B40E2|nr:flagellar biosynthesis protein FlhA [Sphingomonas sp. BK235]TCP34356.1 type III secretion protein V [Sphingomonas sp. BK235]